MARRRALKQLSEKELLEEIARRHADEHLREGMTMTEVELSVDERAARWGLHCREPISENLLRTLAT